MILDSLELYKKIGQYLRKYNRFYISRSLLKDYQHDLFLSLDGRDFDNPDAKINDACFRKTNFKKSDIYNKLNRDGEKREYVILNSEGEPQDVSISYDKDFELEVVKEETSIHHNSKSIIVKFVNNEEREYKGITELGKELSVSRSAIYKFINNGGNTDRYTNRKLSHIKSIEPMSFKNPFNGNKLVVKKTLSETEWKREDQTEFELDDYNEYYLMYRHILSNEGWLVKLKEEKCNPYIKKLVDSNK